MNDRCVNGDRSLSRLCDLRRVSASAQSCISTINRILCAIERTRGRGSCDLLIWHFSHFPSSLSPCAKTLLHLPTHPPALTTFPLTINHHSRSLAGHHTLPQATTSQPPCHNVIKTPIFLCSFTFFSPTFTIPYLHNIFFFDNCTLLVQSVVALCVGFLVFYRGFDKFQSGFPLLGLKATYNLFDKIPNRNSRCLLPPLKLQALAPNPPVPLMSSGRSFFRPPLTSMETSRISKQPNGWSKNSNVVG